MLFISKKMTEANIQAECYHQLRLLGIKSCLEYKTHTKDGKECRFDMVVLKEINDQYHIIAIVEFKNNRKEYDYIISGHKQYAKYSSFDIPLIYCRRREGIPETVDKIVQLINNE
jgi:hypothetical protein